jgi:hypothetical protein
VGGIGALLAAIAGVSRQRQKAKAAKTAASMKRVVLGVDDYLQSIPPDERLVLKTALRVRMAGVEGLAAKEQVRAIKAEAADASKPSALVKPKPERNVEDHA